MNAYQWILEVLRQANLLAHEYKTVAEYEAAKLFRLELISARQAGYDAIAYRFAKHIVCDEGMCDVCRTTQACFVRMPILATNLRDHSATGIFYGVCLAVESK